MIKTCVFDADGKLINIGDWDDFGGENPLPDGAYTEEREVIYDDVHGWRLADAPVPVSDKERIEALEAALLEVILQNG